MQNAQPEIPIIVFAGESLSSKRSSLDRHSEISAGLVVEDDDDDDDGIDNDNAGVSTDDDSDSDHSGKKLSKSKKGGRSALSLLPNISFTKLVTFFADFQKVAFWTHSSVCPCICPNVRPQQLSRYEDLLWGGETE